MKVYYPKLSFTAKRVGICTKCACYAQVSKQFTCRDERFNSEDLINSLGALMLQRDDWLETPHICSTCQPKGKENE
jgi:hypothetical protein